MKYLLIIVLILSLGSGIVKAQGITFQYLGAGENNSSCTSLSDSTTNVQCYAINYVPGATGVLTSYTMTFIGSCGASVPFISNGSQSCVMTDNTNVIDACSTNQLFLLQPSGNNGNISVTSGLEITIHQVCFDVPLGDTIILNTDGAEALTFGITGPSGEPINDIPSYTSTEIMNEFSCEESKLCSVDFGLNGNKVSLATNMNGNIVDGSSLENSIGDIQGFDVYDELAMSCISPGGGNDVFFEFQILNTIDINENGLIDGMAGESHKLEQTVDGITGSIPFNTNGDSESSTGDVRGYSMEVTFGDHIGVIADQLSVNLEGMNSAGQAFESASLVFLDQNFLPYGTVNHLGYYGVEGDLTGACTFTAAQNTYETTGVGVFVFQDTVSSDVTLPCSPGIGVDGVFDTYTVSARMDTGLDSAAVVTGFRLIVLGEDIATSDELDDGSGIAPDDGISANAATNTNATLVSTISGFTIDGCVFSPQIALPVEWNDFSVTSKEDHVNIYWSTSQEINNDYYEVEWSTDGISYSTIASVESQGNANHHDNAYSAKHDYPRDGDNYYRIKQIDLDGSFSYSVIRQIRVDNNDHIVFGPNPVNDLLRVSSGLESDDELQLKIYNSMGQLVIENIGSEQLIEMSSLRPGIYILTFILGDYIESHNLIRY